MLGDAPRPVKPDRWKGGARSTELIYQYDSLRLKKSKARMESILTEKGQTTVPKAVREALRIKPNQRLEWEVESNGTVRVRRERSVLHLFG